MRMHGKTNSGISIFICICKKKKMVAVNNEITEVVMIPTCPSRSAKRLIMFITKFFIVTKLEAPTLPDPSNRKAMSNCPGQSVNEKQKSIYM